MLPTLPYSRRTSGSRAFSAGAGLAVKNAGDLAIKYELAFRNIVAEDGIDSVLDVYVLDSVRAPASADTPVGTLADFKDGRAVASSNLLEAGQTDEAQNVVVKMREGVGNAYAGKTVTFDILLRATRPPRKRTVSATTSTTLPPRCPRQCRRRASSRLP